MIALLVSAAGAAAARQEAAQDPVAEAEAEEAKAKERRKLNKLEDIDSMLDEREKKLKERALPPFELTKSNVAPFDVLPYVKPGHWVSMGFDFQANLADFRGSLVTAGVPLGGSHTMVYTRPANLTKRTLTRLRIELMTPSVPRQLGIELTRRDLAGPVFLSNATMLPLPAHQMLVLVLAKNPSPYASWMKLNATLPFSSSRTPEDLDKSRYYRIVTPQTPERPQVPDNPLAWTTISHVFWDNLPAETLSVDQQQSMLDWLHFGGQLVIAGGAGAWFAPLQESMLGPYLPADIGAENRLLDRKALEPLAKRYRPMSLSEEVLFREESTAPVPAPAPDPEVLAGKFDPNGTEMSDPRYKPAEPILPDVKRPVYFVGLTPREGFAVRVLRVGDEQSAILAVERRVGRGRITMLAFNPNDPAFLSWRGFDSLVRRVILRREEEGLASAERIGTGDSRFQSAITTRTYRFMGAPSLSWFRLASRDLGSSRAPSIAPPPNQGAPGPAIPPQPKAELVNGQAQPIYTEAGDLAALPDQPLAEWNDNADAPNIARQVLIDSSGIHIPGSDFVLKVLFAYAIALVPLNWLICRVILRKKELAWAIMPVLALGFAIGVERAAAFDLGYDSASNEVDLLEVQSPYARAHLSRFGSIYSSGRQSYSLAFPDNATALALPMAGGSRSRADEAIESVFETAPVPTLRNFPVQPRSLAMYRAEEMAEIGGTIRLDRDPAGRPVIVNDTEIELRDAEFIDVANKTRMRIGAIAPRSRMAVPDEPAPPDGSAPPARLVGKLTAGSWIDRLALASFGSPADEGELRLLAWTPGASPGMEISPKMERRTGITVILAHLRFGTDQAPTPDESERRYDVLAPAPRKPQDKTVRSSTEGSASPAGARDAR